MMEKKTLNRILIVVSSLSLIFLGFFSVIQNQFKSPETISQFLKNANSYYYISEIIKANIRSHYPPEFQQNIVYIGIAEGVLNTAVTPELVERLSIPVLKTTGFINRQPTEFVNNNLVLNTSQYKQQISNQIPALELPPLLTDTITKLINSIPDSIVVVDTQAKPNSTLVIITRAGIFLDNARAITTISWVVLLATLIGLVVSNIRSVTRLLYYLFIIFVSSGGVLLLVALLAPVFFANFGFTSPDPVTGSLKDAMINDIVNYLFSLSRNISFIYLILGLISYLVWRFAPVSKLQSWIDARLAH